MSANILPDTRDEGFRVVDLARDLGLFVKLIGGLGVAAHDHYVLPAILERQFGDIDLVVGSKNGKALSGFLTEMGYQANQRFNALHGANRLLFYDVGNQRQVDVFVSEFKMCHALSLENYLDLHPRSLTPEHLLLTKLQIVEINRKDLLDVLRIIYMHHSANVGKDCPGISMERMNLVLASDWGWYTTVTDNMKRALEFSETTLAASEHLIVKETLTTILNQIDSAPKSSKWKGRAIIGRRKSWYEIPEEVDGTRSK